MEPQWLVMYRLKCYGVHFSGHAIITCGQEPVLDRVHDFFMQMYEVCDHRRLGSYSYQDGEIMASDIELRQLSKQQAEMLIELGLTGAT
jgi:hypothetical protein